MKRPKLKPIFFLTLGWFGMQMAMALDATQFQIMLDREVHNALLIGAVLSLGPLAGIIVQPAVGWYGDRLACKGLSREGMMKGGLLVALIATLALSLQPSLPWLVLLIGLFFVGFNVLMVNYRARVTETSGRKALADHKGLTSGFVALFSGAGSFAMFALCSIVGGTAIPFVAAAFMVILTFALFFRLAPNPGLRVVADTSPQPSINLFHPWSLLYYAAPYLGFLPGIENRAVQDDNQRQIFRLFLTVFFSWVGIQALRGYFVLYADKALHLDHAAANILLAVLTLVMLISAIPFGKFIDRFEGITVYRICLLFFALVCIGSYFLVQTGSAAMIMSILLGLSFAGMVVCPLALLFKYCPPRSEGAYSGLYNMFLSLPQLYSLLITGWLIEATGSYRVILAVAFVAITLATLSTLRIRPINHTRQAFPEADEKIGVSIE